MSLRYRLDDLGWLQFEQLVQSLLKADLHVAIQSWGGHGDWGRDAYFQGNLTLPGSQKPVDGPFIFQVKFVKSANAAGSNPQPAILSAVSKEVARIRQRKTTIWWRNPQHYVFITNGILTTDTRSKINKKLASVFPARGIHIFGGTDVCDRLDLHPALRQAHPEILSLRDLDQLIGQVVHRDILERSRISVEEARDLIPYFVSTSPYKRAQQTIRLRDFVVLDGPPEMGKTAIGRLVALTHVFEGWEAVDCRDPDDFFRIYERQRRQIFVADDAFGRTEYDPALGRKWERDLPKVLYRLDGDHRLIITTRKHILTRALREMDLVGRASKFPNPGEVIVDTEHLEIEERAKILYRHARAAQLPQEKLNVIKRSGSKIVEHTHFTPERIRRFAEEYLPTLDHPISPAVIDETIRNPTKRMKTSFNCLPKEHRQVLIALLNLPAHFSSRTEIALAVNEIYGDTDTHLTNRALDDLDGSFLRNKFSDRIDWVHPSVRDLVVEQLQEISTERKRFLESASIEGIKLALSTEGGALGERSYPLLRDEVDIGITGRSILRLSDSELPHIQPLLPAFTDLGPPIKAALTPYLNKLFISLLARLETLNYYSKTRFLQALLPVSTQYLSVEDHSGIEEFWISESVDLLEELEVNNHLDPGDIESWINLTDLVDTFSFISDQTTYNSTKVKVETSIDKYAAQLVDDGVGGSGVSVDEFSSEGASISELALQLSRLGQDENVQNLEMLAERYYEEAPPEKSLDNSFEREVDRQSFTVEQILSDL